MIIFSYDFEKAIVVECTCEVFGHPHRALHADGRTYDQYENTHFRTYDEALDTLHREVLASLSLGARDRRLAKKRIHRLTKELADDAERLVRVLAAVEARKKPPPAKEPEGQPEGGG
jgi:hypothetical protein